MNLLASQRLSLIGRSKELDVIEKAIRSQELVIVYLEGTAGIGKTMLLEEAGEVSNGLGALCPPILDFYDTRMHSRQELEAAIADGLDRTRKHFVDYWSRREKEPQADFWEAFLDGYRQMASEARIVLRFDTAERLEYEREKTEVLLDCDAIEEDTPSWDWLLTRIGDLPNTSVFIAARPTRTSLLRDRLRMNFGEKVKSLLVDVLTIEETKAYFLATDVGRQLISEAPELLDRMHEVTLGRPILISLALDWLQRGVWDRHTVMDIQSHNSEEIIIQQIRDLNTPLDQAVCCAALCRKGCNDELLAQLMGIKLTSATDLVLQLQTLSFVKLPRSGGQGMFFLHDEMYDLVERYIWLADWPDYAEQGRLDQVIINWYDQKIAQLTQSISHSSERSQRRTQRRNQQLIMTEQLHYQLDQDPSAGYREYISLAEQAIGAREREWDDWLRNELLGFVANRPLRWRQLESHRISEIEHDARRLWVNRYIARGWYEKAISVAQNLLGQEKQPGEPTLYRIGLQVALATAQTYKGGALVHDAIKNFEEAIKSIEIMFGSQLERWLPRYLLGIAYLYKGLAVRIARPLVEAQQSYGKAIYYFRTLGYQQGLAEALNNLAFIMAQQGKLRQALAACEEALAIREELADEYNIALSLNTKGIILERLDRPVSAIHQSNQALRISAEINNERGIILAEINLGRAYRRRGRSREWGPQEGDFVDGRKHLLDAITRQEKQGPNAEVDYQIQAQNEIGCLYRDWVSMLHEKNADIEQILSFLDTAEEHLQKAIDLASADTDDEFEHSLQYIDSLEDLARVHYWRARLDDRSKRHEKTEHLQKMKALLDKADDLARMREERWDELKLLRGKIHFQKARHSIEAGDPLEAARNYALAASYAESYSPDAQELTKMANEASYWLVSHRPDEAKVYIDTMRTALEGRQGSKRLEEWIGGVVESRLGVGWDNEVTYG